jgi:hypothetical protein
VLAGAALAVAGGAPTWHVAVAQQALDDLARAALVAQAELARQVLWKGWFVCLFVCFLKCVFIVLFGGGGE